MLHVHESEVMPPPLSVCDKELHFPNELVKPRLLKARARAHSDELSTAAPSPEASPLFGPQASTPLDGPEALILPELSCFELPDAQDSLFSSDCELELAGFDDEACSTTEFELAGFDDDQDTSSSAIVPTPDAEEEDNVESEILDLLGELASLRASARQVLQQEPEAPVQKIPYPPLESGFLPAHFMPTQSWLLPAGRAETGMWAQAMAPRPDIGGMEPLNIVIGVTGAVLEVAAQDECYGEYEQKRQLKAKAIFRRRRGRSRSPLVALDEMRESRSTRGRSRCRPRRWTLG
jgi:hypothetical protein